MICTDFFPTLLALGTSRSRYAKSELSRSRIVSKNICVVTKKCRFDSSLSFGMRRKHLQVRRRWGMTRDVKEVEGVGGRWRSRRWFEHIALQETRKVYIKISEPTGLPVSQLRVPRSDLPYSRRGPGPSL